MSVTTLPYAPLRFRMGRFRLAQPMLQNSHADALAALDGCIVTRAEALWHLDAIEYVAMHADFDVIKPGTEVPLYEPIFSGGRRRWDRVS